MSVDAEKTVRAGSRAGRGRPAASEVEGRGGGGVAVAAAAEEERVCKLLQVLARSVELPSVQV
jgi:hypothetical protein